MFFKREVMFFELPGAGGNDIFWAPRTVYFNLYAFCGASDINNFWQCLDILYECVFDSFTGTDLALTPTSVLALSLSVSLSICLYFSLIFLFFFQTIIYRVSILFSPIEKYFMNFSCDCILRFLVMSMIIFFLRIPARYYCYVDYFLNKSHLLTIACVFCSQYYCIISLFP